MARRFIVDNSDIKYFSKDENIMEIKGKEVKHIQVLRYDVSDIIIVNEYVCKIVKMHSNYIELQIISNAKKQGEPFINLSLFVALLKGDKMDLVIQKAVELGVKTIVPFISKNTIVRLDEKSKVKKKNKYQIIANEACKQCGRTDLVRVEDIITSNNELLDRLSEYDVNIFAYENENKKSSLHETMEYVNKRKYRNISMVIGPEGGFLIDEAKDIKSLENTKCISLGTRILRAETAAINLISIIMYELDNFDALN